ncbi:MAG: endonuclease MutS2 [Clostridia bacterium]|nr:endonuclease MutS2 [Clostridia bacterium]
MVSKKVFDLLEFDKIKESVAACAVSARARVQLMNSQPSFDYAQIQRDLTLTKEGDLLINKYLMNPLSSFDDVSETLERARVGATLSMGELLKVARLIKAARIAKSTVLDAPDDIVELKTIVEGANIDRYLEKEITDCILSEFEMSDKASDKLYGLRRKIQNINAKLKDKLASYTRGNDFSKYLQDNLVTVREGRYVLPVRAECRGEVKGLVHDKSATGSTVYIEPFAIVELNNELRETIAEEQAEVERILEDFTKRIACQLESLYLCQNVCTTLDIILCKAKYSTKIRGILPVFNTKKQLLFKNARHPLIDKEKVVPVNISLGGEYSVLLITGPNTGGKTVCLKTTGLFCLMAYFGLYLPCTEASVYLFDSIFCDIGDEQSIENELSTFSSHVKSLIEITDNMNENSLVLLDEVGGGTDPDEGAALAIGIVKYIESVNASAILTTHYGELKEYALSSKRVENACMEFDEKTLSPTFRLVIGMPGTSNALNIAKRLGLNNKVISYAYNALSSDKIKFEKILHNAERIRKEATDELEKTRKLRETVQVEKSEVALKKSQIDALEEKIRSNASVETKRLVANATERANEIIDQLNDMMQESITEAMLLEAKKLRNELNDLNYSMNSNNITVDCEQLDKSEIKVGAKVVVKSIGATATIRSINEKREQAEVQVGAIKMKISFSDLGKQPKPAQKPQPSQKKVTQGERASSGFSEREVMLLGMTVSEAIEVIEPLILSMANENDAKQLRIVHGKGTGALGKGVQAYLKTNPFVLEFRYGRYGEGDNGVTIATIK